jgi:hypothetical protein
VWSSHAANTRPYSVHSESSGELPEVNSIETVWRGGNVLSSGVEPENRGCILTGLIYRVFDL